MEFRVLGALEVLAKGRRIDTGTTKGQLLLAVLLMERGAVVPFASLVERVWGENAPAKVPASVHAHVSRLRGLIAQDDDGETSLRHVGGIGYRLQVAAERVDAFEFDRLVQLGRRAAGAGEPHRAVELLARAHRLIRGEPLAGLPGSWAEAARAALVERQRAAALTRIRLQMDAGESGALLGELKELSGRFPYDQTIAALLMTALYDVGRSADALEVYAAVYRRLHEGLGIGVHPKLVEAHQRILHGRSAPSSSAASASTFASASASMVGTTGTAQTAGTAAASNGFATPGARSASSASRAYDTSAGSAPDSASASASAAPLDPAGASARSAWSAEPPNSLAPNTLERDPPGFVGRDVELEDLRRQINASLARGEPAICLISGMPGIGKTTLALHLAHRLRSHCPDGALQADLHGHDVDAHGASRLEAVLALLLSMLGVDVHELQRADGIDHLTALWRRHTADRRILIVLDDATDASQVRGLIPNSGGSIVLVTSRHLLPDVPGAISRTLALMPPAEARAVFTGSARPSNGIGAAAQTGAEPTADTNPGASSNADTQAANAQAADAVVAACGRLPLALNVAGGLLRVRSSWTVADLAEHLAQTRSTEAGSPVDHAVHPAFDTSYRHLPAPARRTLRHLALYPGPRISKQFAAALVGMDATEVDLALGTLFQHNLLSEPQRDAYRIHSLIRTFAANTLAREEPTPVARLARARLLRYALTATDRATALFHPQSHTPLPVQFADDTYSPPSFADAQSATTWLDTHRSTLRALVDDALCEGHEHEAALLIHQLAALMDRRNRYREGAELHKRALAIWTKLDDRPGQARALCDLGTAHWRLGALDEAVSLGERALRIWRQSGDLAGQADARLLLGRAHHFARRLDPAAGSYQDAIAIAVRLKDRHRQAECLYQHALVLYDLGRYNEAVAETQQALALAAAVDDIAVERNCACNLGQIFLNAGRYEEALEYGRRALDLARQVGDPRNSAIAALNLGEMFSLTGESALARPHLAEALAAFRRLGNTPSVINTFIAQADDALRDDRVDDAADLYAQAVAESVTVTGDPLVGARLDLAGARLEHARGHHDATLAAYNDALAQARRGRFLAEQAAAHRGIGDCLAAQGKSMGAIAHWRESLKLLDPGNVREAAELHTLIEGSGASAEMAPPDTQMRSASSPVVSAQGGTSTSEARVDKARHTA